VDRAREHITPEEQFDRIQSVLESPPDIARLTDVLGREVAAYILGLNGMGSGIAVMDREDMRYQCTVSALAATWVVGPPSLR